ncbi:MAG: ADP-ribosylglycohydrolase family protein [Tannerellaceae bacterium]|nr:ADP-ribosylglycohydrolase family protein [Tannerellaceae bacterium]
MSILLCLLAGFLPKASAQEKVRIPVEIVVDKIRGGLLGQILGNLNGLPHEMRYIGEPGNVQNYVPSLPEGAHSDDDTDFEWFYVYEMQRSRQIQLDAGYITNLWIERVNRGVWCSNRFVRYLMDIGFKPPYTGYTEFNPWAEFNVSGQFLCETYGLIAPAMPQTAAKIGLNYTTVAVNGEPAQTTQLFTTMIATAFVENDMNKILDAGIASLDGKSKVRLIIDDVRAWHKENPIEWRKTRRLLRDKYTQENGGIRDYNGYELNTGAIVGALLYGNGDFAETLKQAFNWGWDADCNAATAGAVIGVAYGYRRMMTRGGGINEPLWQIVDRYKNVTRDGMPEDETITGFADRLIELFELINENNGGGKKVENNVLVYEIAAERPSPILALATADRKEALRKEFAEEIRAGLSGDSRAARAKAAFMAVCLEMDEQLKKTDAATWKAACYDLSGYWKVMNNVFAGDFRGLDDFSKKFERAGFKAPLNRYEDDEIYEDRELWKDPRTIYHSSSPSK